MSTSEKRGARRSGNGRVDPRRAEFARYKEDVKERGKAFHPFAMFHDTVMSMMVVLVGITLPHTTTFNVLVSANSLSPRQ